jgi:uncharacterized protein (DUF1778 family)
MAQRQINIRLSEDDARVLDAAAFLDQGSVIDLARHVVLQEVKVRREQPRVQQLLRLQAEQAAEEEGTLRPLDARRKRRDGSR